MVAAQDSGGILVRAGRDLKSPASEERLAKDSEIQQLELLGHAALVFHGYPLVIVYITMENHIFHGKIIISNGKIMENQLLMVIFNSYVKLPEGNHD